jgi:hypothetical protein
VGRTPVSGTDIATVRAAKNPRTGSEASNATPSINVDNFDGWDLTAQAAAVTSLTLTGTPVHNRTFLLGIKDNGTARTIALGSNVINSGVASYPTTTVIGKRHRIGLIYDAFANGGSGRWVVMAADVAGYTP